MTTPQDDKYATINFVLIDRKGPDKPKKVGTIEFGVLQSEPIKNTEYNVSPLDILHTGDYGKILWIQVEKEYLGQGYGKLLMILAIGYFLTENANISAIELDDCSDNYGKPNNIYFKLGFRMVNSTNPETLVVSFSKTTPISRQVQNSLKISDFGNIENLLQSIVSLDRATKEVSWDDLKNKFTLTKSTIINGKNQVVTSKNSELLANIIIELKKTCGICSNCNRSPIKRISSNPSTNQQANQSVPPKKTCRTIITRSMSCKKSGGKSSSR